MGPRAGIDIEPAQRQKLERPSRYVSRPPVAVNHIALMTSGQVRYTAVAHRNPGREVYLIMPELIQRTIAQRAVGMRGVAVGEPSGQVIEHADRHLRHLS